MSNKIVNVCRCAVCGENHEGMMFTQMEDFISEGYTHLGQCPDTGEFVYLKEMHYGLFSVNSSNKIEIQAVDELAPEGYTDDLAAIEFVRDLEVGRSEAISIAQAIIKHHKNNVSNTEIENPYIMVRVREDQASSAKI